mmetsp:Transcript_35590/g.102706  ORF Transcript_35590/g.102706 Transcript_35590/m.102706 type:complete len:336 (-) Transcript_35590:1307-2314(-)
MKSWFVDNSFAEWHQYTIGPLPLAASRHMSCRARICCDLPNRVRRWNTVRSRETSSHGSKRNSPPNKSSAACPAGTARQSFLPLPLPASSVRIAARTRKPPEDASSSMCAAQPAPRTSTAFMRSAMCDTSSSDSPRPPRLNKFSGAMQADSSSCQINCASRKANCCAGTSPPISHVSALTGPPLLYTAMHNSQFQTCKPEQQPPLGNLFAACIRCISSLALHGARTKWPLDDLPLICVSNCKHRPVVRSRSKKVDSGRRPVEMYKSLNRSRKWSNGLHSKVSFTLSILVKLPTCRRPPGRKSSNSGNVLTFSAHGPSHASTARKRLRRTLSVGIA